MARSIHKLTDIQLRTWLRAGEQVAISDGGGLTFTLAQSGHASWIYRYRLGGRQKEITLGSYPTLSLQAAREKASAARADVYAHKDVALIKQDQKRSLRSLVTFRELVEDYQAKAMGKLATSTKKQRNQYFKAHIVPILGTIPCNEVTPHQVADLIRKVGKKSTPNVAEGVLTAVSETCKHGQRIGALAENPCFRLQASAITGKPEKARQRIMLSEAELRELLPNLATIGPQNALAVKIQLSTCCRIGELAKAKWCDVDFDNATWTIPAHNSKTGRDFTIPLAPPTIKWFKELEVLAMASNFILPARQGRRQITHGIPMHYEQRALNSMLHKFIPKLKGIRKFTPHDLRSTARSHIAALGFDLVIAERCLNHSLGKLLEVYDKHDYLDQRRLALNVWTSFLAACEAGEDWEPPSNLNQIRYLRLVAQAA